jgi:hypothetical protein
MTNKEWKEIELNINLFHANYIEWLKNPLPKMEIRKIGVKK